MNWVKLCNLTWLKFWNTVSVHQLSGYERKKKKVEMAHENISIIQCKDTFSEKLFFYIHTRSLVDRHR